MLRFVREVVQGEEEDSSTTIFIPTEINTTDMNTPLNVLLDIHNTNSINESITAFSSSSNKQGFSWAFNLNTIIVFAMGLLFLIVLISTGIWYWCNRLHRLRRQNSLPIAVNDFIETTKIQEKRLSSSSIKAPPVPPRPTAYTTILGKVEYRSNL